jgi:hypothetical protein
MNIRRGLFRLWIVISAVWIVWTGWHNLLLLYPPTPDGDWIPVLNEGRVIAAAQLMFGPPLVLLAVVIAPFWIWDGFNRFR